MGPKQKQLRDLGALKGLNYVGSRGNFKAPVVIIGEAPGADEDQYGLPFMGQAGKQLEGQLEEAGFNPNTDVWYTNPYHFRPPGNDIESRHVLGIPDELQIEVLMEELNEFKPIFCITAGNIPTHLLYPLSQAGITSLKGSLLQSPAIHWEHYLIPLLHPAFILRDYSERVFALAVLDKCREELAYFQRNSHLQPLPERQLIDDPNYGDVYGYLSECLGSRHRISHDIENPFFKRIKIPYVFNFATSPKSAISFNLFDFTEEQLTNIWRLIDEVLRTKDLIGQNYINFDSVYVEESVGLRPNIGTLDDTMTRHKVLWPEFPHVLEFQTFQYTREPYYKDEGFTFYNKKKLRHYGCKDAAVTYEVWEAQEAELDKRGLRDFYETIEMPLARNFHWIEKRGILVAQQPLGQLRNKIKSKLDSLCAEATALCGKPVFPSKEEADEFKKFAKKAGKVIEVFNIGSDDQIKKEFARLGLYLPSENGSIKSDEESLQKSAVKTGHRLPALTLETRGLNKLKGTYVNAPLINDTLYTSYTSTGTVNGRRSSKGYYSKTKFAFGTNLQNLPSHGKGIIHDYHEAYREAIVARPGFIFLGCDQVSAEDWIVQGIIKDCGGSPRGFQELLEGVDRHRKLASYIFKKPESACGKESHERFLGKKTRHAGNYLMESFRFAVVLAKEGWHYPEFCRMCHNKRRKCSTCEINTYDLLVDFHAYDPGIKGIFHPYVEDKLLTTRTLVNPFGRTRIFFGLHPYRDNKKVFKEAYSCLPQSTVSDNTAQAVNVICHYETSNMYLVHECHDSVMLEVNLDRNAIFDAMCLLDLAFDRVIRLEHGLEFKIPIEMEMGFDFKNKKKVTKNNLDEVLCQLQKSTVLQTSLSVV